MIKPKAWCVGVSYLVGLRAVDVSMAGSSCVLPPDNGLQLCWLTLKEERRGTLK